jgi:CHAT domain-containing protein/tetratricopeptide (TPR) repeat protein
MNRHIKNLQITVLTLLLSLITDILLFAQFVPPIFAQTKIGGTTKTESTRLDPHQLQKAVQLSQQGSHLLDSGDLPAALKNFQHALDIYTSQSNLLKEHSTSNIIGTIYLGKHATLNMIGTIYLLQGENKKALAAGKQGLVTSQLLLKNIQNQPKSEEIRQLSMLQIFSSYTTMSRAHQNLKQYSESISALEQLLLIIQKSDSPQSNETDYTQAKLQYLKSTFNDLINIYTLQGIQVSQNNLQEGVEIIQKALAYKDQAIEIFQEDQERKNEILEQAMITYAKLGGLYSNHRQYYQSIENYNRALVLAKKSNMPLAEVYVVLGIADTYLKWNNYAKSLETFEELQILSRNKSLLAIESLAVIGIARTYNDIGRYEESAKSFEQALSLSRTQKEILTEQIILNSLGRIYFKQKEYDKAKGNHQKALASYQVMGKYLSQTKSIDDLKKVCTSIYPTILGTVRSSMLDLQQPSFTSYIDESTNKLKKSSFEACLENALTGEVASLSEIGQINDKQGNDKEALRNYHQALEIAEKIHDSTQEAYILRNMAMLHLKQGDITQSMSLLQKALDIRVKNKEQVGQIMTLHGIGNVLTHSGEYKAAEAKLLEATHVFDTLLKQELENDIDKVSLFDTQLDIYKDLQYVLVAQKQPEKALEVSEQSRVRVLTRLLANRLGRTGRKNIGQASQSASANLSTTIDLQKIAQQENATLVEYSVINSPSSKPFLYIWVIKPTGDIFFESVSLESFGGSLNKLVVSSRLSLGVPGRGNSIEVEPINESDQVGQLRRLHDLLIKPIAKHLPTKPEDPIIIIPHESLFMIPFAALQDNKGEYLIANHTLLVAPSIQVLQLARQQKQRLINNSTDAPLVVGNPTMPSITTRVGDPTKILPPIAGAEKEAVEIAQLFKTKAITGSQATKSEILSKLAQARIIHLATHGLLDDFMGLGTPGAIALAPDGNGELNDGLLTASEIFDMKLNAELAVLSACDTGGGTVTGDGVIGLSRSFIAAGVPSVLVSLWSVPDTPTAELMIAFYRNWREKKMDKAQALRQAMLTTMKTHPNPRAWAGFTLIGGAE